uniref:IgGFc_binding domain-containing protein n=1 Tax=Rhabditophanes sp. KR3021 TaxID=114890 RepID=A0AC35TIE0_9BILA
MPTSGSEVKGTIGILPVLKEESISINIVGYANGALFSNETISYAITFGQSQTYISISFDKVSTDVSIAITTSSPVMLSVESPYTVTSNDVESVDIEDFVQFMPIASQPSPCHSFLKHADQRMITNDFTTRLHVSQNLYCDTILNITVYKDNSAGIKQVVDKMGFTKISLMDSKVAGFSTNEGEISTNRFGSILESGVTCGHFMHYVPSTREWLTKKTQFYTLARGCVLEFYADSDGSNTDFIKIDGHKMDTFKYSRKLIPFFDKQYTQFVVTINGYGLHTIENDGNYVAYVICKNVNGPYSADGYLAGFNQWKSK